MDGELQNIRLYETSVNLTGCCCVTTAMSEAVEGAELMLYGVSEKYKER